MVIFRHSNFYMLTLNYKVFGEGDPVIILHGLFGMLDNWQSFAKKMADDYKVFILDQRNHGKSPHTTSHSYGEMADDIVGFIKEHKLTKVKLIGHSMGGKTIIDMAVRYPQFIDRMAVIDMGVKTYTGGHEEIIEALLSVDFNKLKSRKEIDQSISDMIPDTGVRMFLLKNVDRNKEDGYSWKMNLETLVKDYPKLQQGYEDISVSKVETLFVKGGKSRYILEEDYALIKSKFTNSDIRTIEDAGHWVHAEKPNELFEMIKGYFK